MDLAQTPAVPQLYLPSPAPVAGGLAYLLPQDAPSTPSTITFAGSWSTYDGTYLFLEQPLDPGAEAAFAAAAWAFLGDPRLAGTRLAWVVPPGASGLMTGTAVQLYAPDGTDLVTASGLAIPFGSLGLFVGAGTPVTQDEASVAFGFALQTPEQLHLTAQWGDVAVEVVSSAVTLPLTGDLAGCLQLTLELGLDDLDALDAGLRFFYAVPPDPKHPASAAGDFFLASLRYPLFAAGLTLYANLDPLAPLDAGRTFLAFSGADAGQPAAGTAAAVPSWFSDTLGDGFALQPLTGGNAPTAFAALVPAPNRQSSAPSAHDPVYLVPRGDFGLVTTRTAAVGLMCGLSGVEYVELASGSSVLSFFPGSPAFASGFFPGEPAGYTELEPANPPTTSFASVTTPSGTLDYFAQPDQSVLYNYASEQTPGVTTITPLAAAAVQAGTIPWPPAEPLTFPLLSYAGLGGAQLAPYQQLESQVASPMRRSSLAHAPARARETTAAAAASRYYTTPQGLLATYVPGAASWDEIVLAQMWTGAQLLLHDVQGDLLTAFQSNKLFLVASLPSAMGSLGPANAEVIIGGGSDSTETWKFLLDPASWIGYGTILILKFHDLSIEELAGQPSTWASAGAFNASPKAVSKTITDTIAAIDPADPDFATFLAAVGSPAWNGILALNVESPLTQLPAELGGLAVGIDQSEFFAHHIGIQASKIVVPATPADLSIADSSIFGLINYVAPQPLPPQAGDYAFQVQQLKVLFQNSAVASFSSIIDLQINRLFGEPAQLTGSDDNVVQLYGVYQKHVVGGNVQDSYTFQTRSGQSSPFEMDTSKVLNAVALSKGQFVTVTSQSTVTETVSQFVFWGLLDFRALPFDVFSFGRPSGDDPMGLSFGNLVLEMTFDPAASPPVAAFDFDASQLAFDLATSNTPREHSFFQHFPLTVASFTQAKQGTTPAGLGYMGLQTPLTQSVLSYPWYALNFDLNLGSPGALAAEAGFVASLSAAWSPGSHGASYSVFTGLRLPGSSGAKRQISIEGIFDITFKTLEILSPAQDTYVLVLYGIAFEFLSFSFPPTGQVNFVLFGDPTSTSKGDTTLGWYAAYAKPDAKQDAKKALGAAS